MQIDGVILTRLDRHCDQRGWLMEVWRVDETDYQPAMGYVSLTKRGVVRGPHEHYQQSDYFIFITGRWLVTLWDNRLGSPTYEAQCEIDISTPHSLLVPPGVVHAYKNLSMGDGLVLNLPDRLYAGVGRQEAVDEVRWEDGDSPFKL